MLTTVRLRLGAAVAAAVLVLGTAAGAATVDLDYVPFTRGKLVQAQTERADFRASLAGASIRSEGFEGYKPWGVGTGTQNLRNTRVGSFTPFGKTGSGDSVVGNGSKLQVRSDDMRWGRYNLDGSGGPKPGNWLDSNDNQGIKWRIRNVGEFDRVGFFLSDVADVGGKFSIKVGDTVYRDLAGGAKLKNGNIYFVRILLSEAVDRLTIKFSHNINDDGFGLDGVVLGSAAPVPVPPAAALILTGLLGLFGLRRRARTA